MKKFFVICFAIVALGFSIYSQSCFAGSATLILHITDDATTSNTIADTAGSTIHIGGTIIKGNTQVGYFTMTYRSDNYDKLNAGGIQIVLMFWQKGGKTPPENIWIQGVNDFSNGIINGSVSSASKPYGWLNGASAVGTTDGKKREISLELTWDILWQKGVLP